MYYEGSLDYGTPERQESWITVYLQLSSVLSTKTLLLNEPDWKLSFRINISKKLQMFPNTTFKTSVQMWVTWQPRLCFMYSIGSSASKIVYATWQALKYFLNNRNNYLLCLLSANTPGLKKLFWSKDLIPTGDKFKNQQT